jgi:lipoprotein-anchoring transpeptidase ErfK/SrfK
MLRAFGVLVLLFGSATTASAQAILDPAQAQPPRIVVVAQPHAQDRLDLGGGFIEFLFGDRGARPRATSPMVVAPSLDQRPVYAHVDPGIGARPETAPGSLDIDPRYLRQEVAYEGDDTPGTIVIDTPNKFLYLVQPGRRALRYGIGVGRPGFTWAGVHKVTAMKEWPDWVPPEEMLQRQPELPRFMPGGINNPLGARALYLGSTLYRIHGSNEPWTIGQNVSSGCIRMRNADVVDLYERVKVGARVVVM